VTTHMQSALYAIADSVGPSVKPSQGWCTFQRCIDYVDIAGCRTKMTIANGK